MIDIGNFNELIEIFKLPFIARAFFAGVLISLCAAVLGVVLVLKHYSLIGHGLADVGFAAMSAAVALGLSPIAVAAPAVIAASFIIMAYSQKKGIAGDSALGIAAAASLAAGIIITSAAGGFNADVYNYMFGSVIAVGSGDLIISAGLAVVVVGLFILFYNRIFFITVDETFAAASGINVTLYQFLISFLTAFTVVVGMKIMGTLLISALVVLPAVTAKKISRSFKGLVVGSAIISVFCFMIGMGASVIFDIPAGAGIVAANVIFMVLIGIISKFLQRSGG